MFRRAGAWLATRSRPALSDVARSPQQRRHVQHTPFPVRDKSESAPLVAGILGLGAPEARDPFLVVNVDEDVTLDFLDVDACEPLQFTFDVSEQELDEIASRLTDRDIMFWADPYKERPEQVGTGGAGRVLFWEEPSGHLLEIRTGSSVDQPHAERARLVPGAADRVPDWAEGPGLLASARRYKVLVCAVALLCGVLAFAVESQQPVRYAGVARLFLDEPTTSSSDPGRAVRNRAEFLQSRPVMDRAAKIVGGGETAERLARQVTVTASSDTDVVTISVLGDSPEEAALLANAVTSAYQHVTAGEAQQRTAALEDREQKLAAEITSLVAQRAIRPDDPTLAVEEQVKRDQLLALAREKEQTAADSATSGPGLAVVEAAPPDAPAQPRPQRAFLMGAAVGLALGLGVAWWLAGRRPQYTLRA